MALFVKGIVVYVPLICLKRFPIIGFHDIILSAIPV